MDNEKNAKENKRRAEIKESKKREDSEKPVGAGDVTVSQSEYVELLGKAKERDLYYDKYVRSHADFDNARKRLDKERQEYFKYANQEIVFELLSVLDNFQKAQEAAKTPSDFDTLKNGVDLIVAEIIKFLKKNGVQKIETSSVIFDPAQHEAINFSSDAAKPDGVITQEIKTGYTMFGKVIRPAVVIVNKVQRAEP